MRYKNETAQPEDVTSSRILHTACHEHDTPCWEMHPCSGNPEAIITTIRKGRHTSTTTIFLQPTYYKNETVKPEDATSSRIILDTVSHEHNTACPEMQPCPGNPDAIFTTIPKGRHLNNHHLPAIMQPSPEYPIDFRQTTDNNTYSCRKFVLCVRKISQTYQKILIRSPKKKKKKGWSKQKKILLTLITGRAETR